MPSSAQYTGWKPDVMPPRSKSVNSSPKAGQNSSSHTCRNSGVFKLLNLIFL